MQQNIKVKNWLEQALQSERDLERADPRPEGQVCCLSRLLPATNKRCPRHELENMTNRIADLRLDGLKLTSSVMHSSRAMRSSTNWKRVTPTK
ncbi:hypothetical protein ACNKHX_02505 [Shigella flexneri]